MQKNIINCIIVLVACLLFASCASTKGAIQTNIIEGITDVDATIQKSSDSTREIGIDSTKITDTSSDITESQQRLEETSNDIADTVNQLASELRATSDEQQRFTEIIQRVQERESVDYIDTSESD